MSLAFLEYIFIFDPSETWSNLHEFESDLGKYFMERGLDAVNIETVRGQMGRAILYLKRSDKITTIVNDKNENTGNIKQNLIKIGRGKKTIIKPQGKVKELPKIKGTKRRSISWYE